MVQPDEEPAGLFQLPRNADSDALVEALDAAKASAQAFAGVDASFLDCEIDTEVADRLLAFCVAARGGRRVLRLAHTDLSSGTDTEQKLFERLVERDLRDRELKMHQEGKKKAANEKDFAVSAAKRRAADEGISSATARIAALDEELGELNRKKKEAPWYMLLSTMQNRERNHAHCLDLSDCCLHATGLKMLTQVMMDSEHKVDHEPISELVLDGNDIGDIGMGSIANLLFLTSSLKFLRLRNVGITDRGVSQVLSGLVRNKSLRLLDLRGNGLAPSEVTKAALVGVQRFNPTVEVLLD